MKESDKNLEKLIEKMMSEDKLQTPSFDFTSKIMSEVLVLEEKKLKTYKPLISKSVWISIGIALALLIIYVSFFTGTDTVLDVKTPYVDKISGLFSGIHISKTLLYTLLIVPIMMLIQIGVLKNYFDKKYNL
ncbi:hypothetical protein ASE21_05945 [Flavobacterium sp. Root901]|uniref:hypothetical protein n=1 Tax=Flavobacterium sp. Root901 TaxID=1736605 RepID=UPI000709258A|nr:hypothetical protein [Flavobacterium sp. Root901]KRD11247.1 hypothetical protein ASE21_05945 [Flavobacterium sp. Root901]